MATAKTTGVKHAVGARYRQGDVILKVVDGIPKGAKTRKDKGSVILREGSATGHKHQIKKGAVVKLHESKEYLHVTDKTASLVHEEHDTIKLPKGAYEIIPQREHTAAGIRNVMD